MSWALEMLRTGYLPVGRWPADDARAARCWLTATEQSELDRLHDPARRAQWLAGRWTAKQLLERELGERSGAGGVPRGSFALHDIQITTRDSRGRGIRPRVAVHGRELPWSLSISHSERGVLVALATANDCSLGVDLATKQVRAPGFLRLWFSAAERRWLAADPARRTATLWAMKEATYKAGQAGEGWCPRAIEVRALAHHRFACLYDGRLLAPLWTDVLEIDDQVAALVCLPRARSLPLTTSLVCGNRS